MLINARVRMQVVLGDKVIGGLIKADENRPLHPDGMVLGNKVWDDGNDIVYETKLSDNGFDFIFFIESMRKYIEVMVREMNEEYEVSIKKVSIHLVFEDGSEVWNDEDVKSLEDIKRVFIKIRKKYNYF